MIVTAPVQRRIVSSILIQKLPDGSLDVDHAVVRVGLGDDSTRRSTGFKRVGLDGTRLASEEALPPAFLAAAAVIFYTIGACDAASSSFLRFTDKTVYPEHGPVPSIFSPEVPFTFL
ncbi:hypothetical protein MPER_13184 [Moniliophthora perniciosa FA553]|nr:hypothetical protein MPER_13184 [Moniliophthora perniciosa FA553]